MNLMRERISEPARYYDSERCIVMRRGLLIVEERRYLWHELVHADRRDKACDGSVKVEVSVEREAVRRALPMRSLEWAFSQSWERHLVAEMLKLPEEWIQFRLDVAAPYEQAVLRNLVNERWSEGVA